MYNPYTADYGFGVSNQFDAAVYGPNGILGSSSTPKQGTRNPTKKPTDAENAQIFQFALASGLQIFSTIFGAITAVDQANKSVTTLSGQEVPISTMGPTDVTDKNTIIYQDNPSADEDDEEWYENTGLLIGGGAVLLVGVLLFATMGRR